MRRATVIGVALALGVLAGCDDPASLVDPQPKRTRPAHAVAPAGDAFNEEDYLVLLVAPDMWRDAGFSSLTRVRLAVLASSTPAQAGTGSLGDRGQAIHSVLTGDEAARFRDLFTKANLPHACANPSIPGAIECGTYSPPAGAARTDLVTACPWQDTEAWASLAPMAGARQIPTLSDALAAVGCDDSAVRAVGADWLLKASMDDAQRGAVATALQQAIKAPPPPAPEENRQNELLINALLRWVGPEQAASLAPALGEVRTPAGMRVREHVWLKLLALSPEEFKKQFRECYERHPEGLSVLWLTWRGSAHARRLALAKGMETDIREWERERREKLGMHAPRRAPSR